MSFANARLLPVYTAVEKLAHYVEDKCLDFKLAALLRSFPVEKCLVAGTAAPLARELPMHMVDACAALVCCLHAP